MKNKWKRLLAAAAAFAVAFTTVAVTDVTTAEAAEYETLYESTDVETAAAGEEAKYTLTASTSGNYYFTLYTAAPVDYTITVYNSAGNVMDWNDNPYTVTSSNSAWGYSDTMKAYFFDDSISLTPGDYIYGIKFNSATEYLFAIDRELPSAKISQSKATITAGFTQKLSVSGAKVTKWSSSKTSVATVDSKGKVTAKKAGKTTISAKCDNGQTVKCTVTVKANKYSASKLTTSDVSSGSTAMSVYSASYDSKGNLVIKACYVNNNYYKTSQLKNIKITVKSANGKSVGTYSLSKKSVSVPSYSTKTLTFTISKSKLKQKKADLRNCDFKCSGVSMYYY